MQSKDLAKVEGAKFLFHGKPLIDPSGRVNSLLRPMLCCPCVGRTDFMCVKGRMLLYEEYVYVYTSRSPAE